MIASESESESSSDCPSDAISTSLEGDKDNVSDDTKNDASDDSGGKISAYELIRVRNVARNNERMRQLGLLTPLTEAPTTNREKRSPPSSSSFVVRKSPRLQALQDNMRRL